MRETYDSGRRRDSAHRMNSPLPPPFFLPSFFPFFFVRSMALLRFRCGCWRVEKGKRDGPGENEGKCRLTNGSIDPPASRFFAFLLSSLASFGLILPREEGRQRKKPAKKKKKIGVNVVFLLRGYSEEEKTNRPPIDKQINRGRLRMRSSRWAICLCQTMDMSKSVTWRFPSERVILSLKKRKKMSIERNMFSLKIPLLLS